MPFIWEAFYFDESQVKPNSIRLKAHRFMQKNRDRKMKFLKGKEEEEQRINNSIDTIEKSNFFKEGIQEDLKKESLSQILEKNNSFLNQTEFFSCLNSFKPNDFKEYEKIDNISNIESSGEKSFGDTKSIAGMIGEISKNNKKVIERCRNINKAISINLKYLKNKIKTEKNISGTMLNGKQIANFITKRENKNISKQVDRFSFVNSPSLNQNTCFMTFMSKQPFKSSTKQKMKIIKQEIFNHDSKLTNDSKLRNNTKAKISLENTKVKIDLRDSLSNRSTTNPRLLCSCSKNTNKASQTQIKSEHNNSKKLSIIPEINRESKLKKKDTIRNIKKCNTMRTEKQNKVNFVTVKNKNFSSVNINLNVNLNMNMNFNTNNTINNYNNFPKHSEAFNFFSEKTEKENLFVISEAYEKNPTPFMLCDDDKNYVSNNNNLNLVPSKLSELNLDLQDFTNSEIKRNLIKDKITLRKSLKLKSKPFGSSNYFQRNTNSDSLKKEYNVMSRNTPKSSLNKQENPSLRHTINNFKNVNTDDALKKKNTSGLNSKLITPRKNNPLQLNNTKTQTSTKKSEITHINSHKKKTENIKTIPKDVNEKKSNNQMKKNMKILTINTKVCPSTNSNSGANTTKSSKDKAKKTAETPKNTNLIKGKSETKK
jgi:hypothetical protein